MAPGRLDIHATSRTMGKQNQENGPSENTASASQNVNGLPSRPHWGAWKWNFSAPKVLMTVSKMPNCSAVKVPIMTQRAPRPCVHSFTTPVSLVMFIMRCGMEPSPPAPALFTFESRVSAGCEMMADTTPAMTPEPRETEVLSTTPQSFGLLPMLPYMASAARPCTANFAMVYGICLKRMGPKPE